MTHAPHLDQIRVRFATFRDVPVPGRTAMADGLRRLDAKEHVLLETCHRVELVSLDEGPASAGELVGEDAVRRLFEVVAGFDSAVVAEEQLLGQVRRAYEAALAGGRTGPILNELFRRALRFGRIVRSQARPGTDRSLADRAVRWLLDRLEQDHQRVVVAGSGEMGRRAADLLATAGHAVIVVSSSEDRARRVVESLAGRGHHAAGGGLTRALVGSADAVVLATRTPAPLLTGGLLGAAPHPWTVDLSVPPAVAADAGARLGDRLVEIDGLGRLGASAAPLDPATERRLRARLEEEVASFIAWLEARRGADALAILHRHADAVRRRHLDRLRRRGRLGSEALEEVEAASAAMMAELLHGPSVELRVDGTDAATVRRLFGIEA